MTLRETLSTAPAGHWAMLKNCPRIHHMMTGIVRAGVRQDGTLRALYEDGTENEGSAPPEMLDSDEPLTLLKIASHFSP